MKKLKKMMGCGSLSNGYVIYTCDHCNNYLYVPFSYISRFCCSCGTKYALDRADTIARKCILCPHRHIAFTIHQALGPLFQEDRSLLNLLFDAVSSTLLSWFYDLDHKENFTPWKKINFFPFIMPRNRFQTTLLSLLEKLLL